MIFLLLAIISSAMIAILMRISSDKISANISMLAANYFICALFGAIHGEFKLVMPHEAGSFLTVWLGIISGFLYLAGFMLLQLNTRKYGVVLSSVFMKLGLLVPIVVSLMFFKEIPTIGQIVGFFVAIMAIVLMNLKEDKSEKGFGAGLIIMLLAAGGADVMAKVFDVYGTENLSALYLFYTFATAFVLCVMLALQKREKPGLRDFMYGGLIGIPNYFSSRFLLGALTQLPAVVVYPSFSVATMLIVTLTGVLVFKERLNKVQWMAMGAIVAALILLNI